MPWNWQHPDWPRFTWRPERLAEAERLFLLEAGRLDGASRHLTPETRDAVAVDRLIDEALTTSAIEGEILNRASVKSSIRRALGLKPDSRAARAPAAREEGIAAMMADVHHRFAEPLDEPTLCTWQAMIVRGRRDLRDVGRYRTHAEAMQIVSGRIDQPRVHFEAPPSSRVPQEMRRFVAWFNAPADTQRGQGALTRAGLAHLDFVAIHPFEDGNGRVGRAIVEKALAQGIGRPTLIALADTLLRRRAAYYDALAATNRSLDADDWLAWFSAAIIEAQRRAAARVEFTLAQARLLEGLRDDLNPRQEKALLRMAREGPDGFKGGLTASKYIAITRASAATATRDLAGLVDCGALLRAGDRRHTHYTLALPQQRIAPVVITPDGKVVTDSPDQS